MVELKDKTKIKFHKGTHTIGGTLIEISYNKSRIFFDMGGLFNREVEVRNLDDMVDNDLCAYVDGLYDKNASKKDYIKDDIFYKNEAIFVSHTHLDHTSLINYTNPKLDLYMSKDSKNALEAMSINNKFVYPFYKKQKIKSFTRKIKGVAYGESVEIGDIKVEFVRVDHDAYGACGFIINTPDKKIAYTGDIRLHGFRKNDSLNFIKKAQNTDFLISEAVSFSFNHLGEDEKNKTEEDLLEDIVKLIKDNPNKAILFNYYQANFERIEKIIEKTKNIRKIVFSAYNAYTIKKVLGLDVYFIEDDDFNYGLNKDYKIDLSFIKENKKDFILQIKKEYVEIVKDFKDSIYIHTDAEPLGDYDPYYGPFMDYMEKNNVDVKIMKTSGHADTLDLYYILSEINPKKIYIIHSKNPEWVYNNSEDKISTKEDLPLNKKNFREFKLGIDGKAPFDGEEIIL